MFLDASNPEVWWTPTDLQFQEIHARGGTDWTTINLSDADGIAGQGEITSTQLTGSIAAVTARLANRLRGQRIASDDHVMRILGIDPSELEQDQRLATAVSGLRCAVADALAQRAQMPLSQYLRYTHQHDGDLPDKVQLYGNINRSLLPDDRGPVDRGPDDFAEMAVEAVSNGFTTLKCAPFDECRAPFNSTGLPRCAEAGLERVQTIREAVGPDITIFVDCHSRFDLDSALALEPDLRAAGGQWFEEPVDPVEHSDDLRIIHEHAILPIAGAEHGYGVDLFKRLLNEDILDMSCPTSSSVAGPSKPTASASNSSQPTPAPSRCTAHPDLSHSSPAHTPPSPSKRPSPRTRRLRNRLATHHLEPYERVENGHLILPEGPGLGARVDPVAVAFKGKSWNE